MKLRAAGFDVVEAEDGKDALAKAEGKNIDLVVTDINMPGMDGIELIKALRAKDEFKFTPIIVLSTLSQKEKVEEGKQAGATGWLYKPFDAKELITTVKKFV
jgi:two-component system chemotaxis response regulator CheY